ncbi:transcription termination factor Rho [Verrucomicrobiaceae bacterium N1E253]|uniref:Transcription termination factor Rho n=1 Tax=Oceaniferula marina TaxID=2748318 RepID=A0A851GFU0_9BACT|nr:transcription termination factor Rho [Oceaniferula marina]NWK56266.1 transcription termination factor Rho [Oceaniferula marina]
MSEELEPVAEDNEPLTSESVPEPAAETAAEEAATEETATDEQKQSEKAPMPAEEVKPVLDLPESLVINELRLRPLSDIYAMLEVLPVKIPAKASKSQLIFELVSFYAREGVSLVGEGILEQAKDNYAMLRDPVKSFKTSPDDLYISGNMIREHGLTVGQKVKVELRGPKGRDKYISANEVLEVEGVPVDQYEKPKSFDHLTAMFPDQRVILENKETGMTPRVLDLIAPLGKGQRGLIVAPPRGGKTIMLKQIAKSIQLNHPEVELIILLLDERPEEVTDFEETVEAEVFSSTFDEPAKRHAQVSDLVMERAKRLVELGKDVVLLLDSLTRLARGHNNSQRGGPIGSGGLSPVALQQSRKFFGAARNCEEGGSLTILATALIETESKMDDVIFEEFKGTGNMEVRLDRELAEQRIYPAIHIPQSGTRNDDRLYHPAEMDKVLEIRRQLASLPIGEAIQTLLKNLSKTGTNAELLLSGLTIGGR